MLQAMGSQRVGHNQATGQQHFLSEDFPGAFSQISELWVFVLMSSFLFSYFYLLTHKFS